MNQVQFNIGDRVPVWQEWEITGLPKKLTRRAKYTVRCAANGEVASLCVICIGTQDEVAHARQKNTDEETIRRYFRHKWERTAEEMRSVAAISTHPHIVTVDAVEAVEGEDGIGGVIYARAELLPTVLAYFASNRLSKESILSLAVQACEALKVCCGAEVCHRNIAPQSFFATQDGMFKLGNFDYKLTTAQSVAHGRRGQYAAPEWIRGETYDSRSDLYSLGVVLYTLCNGGLLPFATSNDPESLEQALTRRMTGEIFPPLAYPDEDMESVLQKACAFNPDDRYQTPEEMQHALLSIVEKNEAAMLAGLPFGTGEYPLVDDAGRTAVFAKTGDQVAVDAEISAAAASLAEAAAASPAEAAAASPAEAGLDDVLKQNDDALFAMMTAGVADESTTLFASTANGTAVPAADSIRPAEIGADETGLELDSIRGDGNAVPAEPDVAGGEEDTEGGEEEEDDGKGGGLLFPVLVGMLSLALLILLFLAFRGCDGCKPTDPKNPSDTDPAESDIHTNDNTEPGTDPYETEPTTDPIIEPKELPNLVGKTAADACNQLLDEGFVDCRVSIVEEESETVAEGVVMAQSYDEEKNALILTVSSGPHKSENEPQWSDWMAKLPAEVAADKASYTIEAKLQYTYRTLSSTTSTQEELTGWTRLDDETEYSEWGEWSEWGDEALEENDATQVEKKTVYRYRVKTGEEWTEYGEWGEDPLEETETCRVEIRKEYRRRIILGTQTSTESAEAPEGYTLIETVPNEEWSEWTTEKPGEDVLPVNIETREIQVEIPNDSEIPDESSAEPSESTEPQDEETGGSEETGGNEQETPKPAPETITVTQYRTRAFENTYVFVAYSEWSDWTETEYTEDESTEVECRSYYRSSTLETIYGAWTEWSDDNPEENEELAEQTVETEEKEQTRSSTRTITYHFQKWGSWSNWTDTAYTASDVREINTRTVYRYKEKQ